MYVSLCVCLCVCKSSWVPRTPPRGYMPCHQNVFILRIFTCLNQAVHFGNFPWLKWKQFVYNWDPISELLVWENQGNWRFLKKNNNNTVQNQRRKRFKWLLFLPRQSGIPKQRTVLEVIRVLAECKKSPLFDSEHLTEKGKHGNAKIKRPKKTDFYSTFNSVYLGTSAACPRS